MNGKEKNNFISEIALTIIFGLITGLGIGLDLGLGFGIMAAFAGGFQFWIFFKLIVMFKSWPGFGFMISGLATALGAVIIAGLAGEIGVGLLIIAPIIGFVAGLVK